MNQDSTKDPLRRRFVAGGLAALLLPRAGAAAGWSAGTPESQGMDTAALDAVLADGAAVPALRALLVARNGVLVAERLYGGAAADQARRINSATKSVVSLLVGQALAQGKISSLSQTIAELLPLQAARVPGSPAAALSLRQILTGTTRLVYDFSRDMQALTGAADPVQHVLALPRADAPAGSWSYNDAAVSLLGPVLERAYALPLPEIAGQQLLGPLGIGAFRWGTDRAGQAPAYMGLELRPRDFLKLASLVAQGGAGIVPGPWLADSLRPHVGGAWPLPPVADSSYGYLWFSGTLRGRPVAWAWGYGAQLAFVVPSQQLAVVTLAQEPPPQRLAAQNRAVAALVGRVVEAAG